MSKNSAKSNYTQLTDWLNVVQSKRSKAAATRKPSQWYEAETAKQNRYA